MRTHAYWSGVVVAVGLALVAAVGGALVHAGLPRDTPAGVRQAVDAQHAAARALLGQAASQEAYGLASSTALYLASLGAFGERPPANLARFTAGASQVASQPRDARVDVLASVASELPPVAARLREARLLDPATAAALQPLPAETLDALRRGPVPVDPEPYAGALAALGAQVAAGRDDADQAARRLADARIAGPAAAAPLPIAAGILCLLLAGVFAPVALRASRRHDALVIRATTDPLTGVANRRRLEEDLDGPARGIAALMLDLDHFKLLNDRAGHAAGDEALRRVAAAIAACLRQRDVVYRYGGEEFCVLLPDTALDDAAIVAERVRAVIEALPVPGEDTVPGGRLTASIGVAAASLPRQSVIDADGSLYAAKAGGRNRVVAAR